MVPASVPVCGMALAATPGVDGAPHHHGAVARIDAARQHAGHAGDQRAERVHQVAGQMRPRGVPARRVQRDLDLVGRRGDRPGPHRDPADRQPRIAVQREDPRHPGQRARGDRVDRAAGHQLLGGLEDQPHPDRQFGHRRQRQRGARAGPRCARRGRRRARRWAPATRTASRCGRPSAVRPCRRATRSAGRARARSRTSSPCRRAAPSGSGRRRPDATRRTAWWRTPAVPAPGACGCACATRRGRRSGPRASASAACGSTLMTPPALAAARAPGRARRASRPARTIVRASMIAPSTTALSALGPAAAVCEAGWCTDAPPASMPTIGWMPGIICVTLPMSVLPSGSAASISLATGARPSRPISPRNVSASHLSGVSSSIRRFGLGRPRDSQPVATAPARKQSAIRPSSSTQRGGVVGAHRVLQLGARRDDVGGLTAVGDDAVRHLTRRQLLTQQPDRHLRHRDRVDGVEPEVRRDGGVCFPARVADGDLRQRQRPRARDVESDRGAASPSRRCRRTSPAFSSSTFPPPASSAGVPSSTTVSPSSSATSAKRQGGADGRRRDDVVSTRVSDPGQRVVLGADADDERAAAVDSARNAVSSPPGADVDLEPVLGHQRLRLGAAAMFGEREFGLGVNGVRKFDQVATASVDGVLDGVRHGERWASWQYLTAAGRRFRQISSPTVTDAQALAAEGGRRDRRAHRRRPARRRRRTRVGMGAGGRTAGRPGRGGTGRRVAGVHPADRGGTRWSVAVDAHRRPPGAGVRRPDPRL